MLNFCIKGTAPAHVPAHTYPRIIKCLRYTTKKQNKLICKEYDKGAKYNKQRKNAKNLLSFRIDTLIHYKKDNRFLRLKKTFLRKLNAETGQRNIIFNQNKNKLEKYDDNMSDR